VADSCISDPESSWIVSGIISIENRQGKTLSRMKHATLCNTVSWAAEAAIGQNPEIETREEKLIHQLWTTLDLAAKQSKSWLKREQHMSSISLV